MNAAFQPMLTPESSLGAKYSFDIDLASGLTDDQSEQLSDMLRVHADLRTLVLFKRKLDTLIREEATVAAREPRACSEGTDFLAIVAKNHKKPRSQSGGRPMNRRQSFRVPGHLAFDVYLGHARLGRFWTHNVSQEGMFLGTSSPKGLTGGVLDLRFHADGSEHRLRGIVVHQASGKGVGIQLAYWRKDDRPSHLAYLRVVGALYDRRAT
jgi:hypothetical protein